MRHSDLHRNLGALPLIDRRQRPDLLQSSILTHMRTTLNLDDDLIQRARKLTGLEGKTALSIRLCER